MHIYTVGSMAFVQSAGFTLLSFALVISVVVFFHELGHLLVGKALGVRAIRFSIGFGPKLFGFKGKDTEYRVSLLPLGGYVKFAGDNPYEEVAPEDRGRGFLEQPPWKKGLIAFGGPTRHLGPRGGALLLRLCRTPPGVGRAGRLRQAAIAGSGGGPALRRPHR